AFLWIRGPSGDEKVERLLRVLPAVARYEIASGNRLRNLESRIPTENLPALNWQSVNAWLRVQMPLGPLNPVATRSTGSVALRIVGRAEECRMALLMTTLEEGCGFALKAPEIRLRRLLFAADEAGSVVIRGTPLPPLPGRKFVL